jgi:glutamine synthetase
MLLMPHLETAIIDPVYQVPTVSIICDVADPITRERYSRDPRDVAKKAIEHLRSTGVADTAYFGPEPEFFVFDDVRFEQTTNTAFYDINLVEGAWNTGADEGPNLGYKLRGKEGYSSTPPHDTMNELRWAVMEALEGCGIPTEIHHHEVSTGGQNEVSMTYGDLVTQADRVQL